MSIQKITNSLDKVCTLYKSLDNGMKVNMIEFNRLLDPIINICNSRLCLLISYYNENDIIRKNKYMNSEPKLKDIIISMLDNNKLEISYEELYTSLKTLYYKKYEEDYETSLYKKVKDKVILLNSLRVDKTKYTFYDMMAMCDQILDNFMDDYYEEDTLDNASIELYNMLIDLLNSKNCNVVDDKNNTILTYILSKYYNGYCREIQYNDTVYSMKNLINIIINNVQYDWNIVSSYGLNILSMICIIKKYGTYYEEYLNETNLDIDDNDDIYNTIKLKYSSLKNKA